MSKKKDIMVSDSVLKKRGFGYFLKNNIGFLYILPWLIGLKHSLA